MTILSKENRENKILDLTAAFTEVGCPEDIARSISAYITINDVIEQCRQLWSKIPTYKQARASGSSENPCDHFDKHWRIYQEAGLLFQHMLKDYDTTFITDLHGYLRRHDNIEKSAYQISSLKDYNNMLADYYDTDFAVEMLRIADVIAARRIRGDYPKTQADR